MEKVSVIGIGRLGLCFALFLSKKFKVLGMDLDKNYVDKLNKREYTSFEPGLTDYFTDNFSATTDLKEALDFSDTIFIFVPTPNCGGDKFYDHTILSNLLMKINNYKVVLKNIVICCTVMPTYITQIGKGLLCDCDRVTLNYNPSFVAQGDIIKGYEKPDFVLLGVEGSIVESKLKSIYNTLYGKKVNLQILNPTEAEITKLSINAFIATKISYANTISDLCQRYTHSEYNVNKNKVLNAIGSDLRIGNKFFKPGLSYGGPCLPRDTQALSLFLEQSYIDSAIVKAADKYNNLHSNIMALAISDKLKKDKKDKDIYIMEDVCFKPNRHIPLIEESPKLKIANALRYQGITVKIKDLKEIIDLVRMEYGNVFLYEIVEKI